MREDTSLTAKERLLKAMKTATKYDEFSGAPYYLMNVKTGGGKSTLISDSAATNQKGDG